MKRFIKKLQKANEATKKLWLVILSAAAMAIIIGIWLMFNNLNLTKIQQPSASKPLTSKVQKEEPGAKDALLAGLKIIGGKINDFFSQKNNFVISNSDRNFILETLPKVPKTTLP